MNFKGLFLGVLSIRLNDFHFYKVSPTITTTYLLLCFSVIFKMYLGWLSKVAGQDKLVVEQDKLVV